MIGYVTNQPSNASFMKIYKLMKFRMKIAYEAWSRKVDVCTLV